MDRKRLLATGISIAALALASFVAGSLISSGGTNAADRGHSLGATAPFVTATPSAALVNEPQINPPTGPQDPQGGSNSAGQNDQQHANDNQGQQDANDNQDGQHEEPEVQPEPKDEEDEPLVVVQLPSVVSVSPANGATGVNRDAPVTIKFTQSMDRQSVQKGFSMETTPLVLALGMPSFEWNDDSTQMTFKPAAPLPYGTQVEVAVAKTAKSADGYPLSGSLSSSYTIVKQSTVTLRSQDANDGHVFAPPVAVFGSHVVTDGNIKVGTWSRGFLSFSLDKLPDDLIKITGAELKVYQLSAHADAYSNATGGLWAQSVFYGGLNIGAFSVQPFTFMGHTFTTLLSETPGMGNRSTDVTHMVQKDWSLRGEQDSLSQFRLMFAKENAGAGPDVSVTLRGSDAPSRYPTLTITYEYR